MNNVDPPDRTMFEYKVFLKSRSDFLMEYASTCMYMYMEDSSEYVPASTWSGRW